jgi:hypothetical protein
MNSSNRLKKIPLYPPFSKGEELNSLLCKRRAGEDFTETVSSIDNPVPKRGQWLAMTRLNGVSASYRRIREVDSFRQMTGGASFDILR